MTVAKKRSLFPLHMTPFESYMFVDDSPQYPMTFVLEWNLVGTVDREALQAAIDEALARHPMLRANIRPAKSSRDCWVLAEDYDSRIVWSDPDQPIHVAGTGAYLDLRNQIGFKCWCRLDAQQAQLITVFHHCVCDGIGAYQFMGDVFWLYANHTGESYPELRELDPADLRKRLRCSLGSELVQDMYKSSAKFLDFAQPLAPRQAQAENSHHHEFPQLLSHTFGKDDYRELRLLAQDKGQTLNDRMLESLFVAILEWNRPLAENKDNLNITINMPLDLRQPEHPVFSATNQVTCAFIGRSDAEIANRSELANSLREQLMQIKHTRFNSEFMKMLLEFPVDLNQASEASRGRLAPSACLATAVFSNTGDPTRRFLAELPRKKGIVQIGNLLLEDLAGASPLRPQTRVAVNTFTYRRNLKICMRFDPHYFAAPDGKAFLDCFVSCLANGSQLP